ncbi:hypothetical protein AAG570_011891 [Ranatra chinensis]|uniref:Uncharacterized protein n=1 Tax=Ranatra chinensis TaxID=642074 RepID=A0ABD0Z5J3_9HEMI
MLKEILNNRGSPNVPYWANLERNMVVERSDVKRRRRDAQDPLEGSPKRTKVHAQRKFAQGSGVLTTGAVTMTPIKEKPSMMGTIGGVKVNGVGVPAQSEPVGVEQIGGTSLLLSASSSHQLSVEPQSSSAQTPSPANRPNTEDFLTFLCFRGTNVLPPRLNMFNTAYRSDEQEQQESTSVSQNTSKQLSSKLPNQDNSQKPKRNSGQSSSSGAGGGGTGLFSGPKQKIKQQGLATVQALKDKYRRQRLSQRQKVSLTKLAMKVKGKNMIRTRSAVLLEERKKKKKYSAPSIATASTQQQRHHTTRVRPRSHQVILKRLGVNKARAGLRSGGVLPPSADNRPKKERKLRRDNSSVESPKNPQKSTSKGFHRYY